MTELKNVFFKYTVRQILDDFSLSADGGRCICLTGASGRGKTTVLKLIAGLLTPDSGTVTAPEKISYVFQEDRLIPNLNVFHNISLFTDGSQKDKINALLKEAELSEFANFKPNKLSGGMSRRVSIIRAIVYGGDVLLLDEPFNGLDDGTKEIMANMIKREFIQKNKPVIMVSHYTDDAEIMNAEIIKM